MFCTTLQTILERLLTYLSDVSLKAGSSTFQIPFDRQQLADYLTLDRNTISKELGKMKRGWID
ncbi:MAG: helix-turn-helix domain-containing protein [Blautia sp.]